MKSMPSMVQYPEPTPPASVSFFRSHRREAHKAYRPLGKLEAHLLFIHEIHAIHGSISGAYAHCLRIPFPLTPARSSQSLQTAGRAGSSPYSSSMKSMPSMVQYPEPTPCASASLFRSNWHEAHKAYRPLGKLEAYPTFASQATIRRCLRLNSMPMQSTGMPSARYRSA
jgi:hypothetical protein